MRFTVEYLSIVLSRVFVAGWNLAGEGPNPSEIWSLSFGAITQNYRHKRLTDGVYLAPVSITYDIERNAVS